MESLKAAFHRMRPASAGPSQTPNGTNEQPQSSYAKATCDQCDDIGWLLTKQRDRDGFPETAPCLDCAPGVENWRGKVGLKVDEKTPTFADFAPDRQPGPLARETAHEALDLARGWIVGAPVNLVLSGLVGVGKTHLAKAALWDGAHSGEKGYYITAGSFDRWSKDFEVKPWIQERRRQVLFNVPFLVLDDFGSGNRENSAWLRERLAELFDERYRAGVGSLITTNLLESEFVSAIGVRSWDRLHENGVFLSLAGVSLRGSAGDR